MLTTNMRPNPLRKNHRFISKIILDGDYVPRVNAINSLIMATEEIFFHSVRSFIASALSLFRNKIFG
jgi:hypothetical protein